VGVSEATQTAPIRPDEITAPERPALAVPPPMLLAAASPPASEARAVPGQAPRRAESPPDHEVIPLLKRQADEWI
jgi:hypothetical protein